MNGKWVLFVLISSSVDFACKSSSKCERFFVYNSAQINIKGISTKLRKNGEVIKEKTIGSIFIDPKFVQASDELQRLDLYQKTLCEQLGAIKSDSLKEVRRLEYFSALLDMMKIAQRPDSFLSSRVGRLETAEEKRAVAEQYLNELKRTPPSVNVQLFIHPDSTIMYVIEILNDVPFKFRSNLGRYDNKSMSSNYITTDSELNPNKGRRWLYSTGRKVNDPQLPKEEVYKVKFYFRYYSIYLNEVNAPGLSKEFIKIFSIDRIKGTITEIKE